MTLVLADGSLRTFTNDTDPFLMRAVRVSLGKLGIIVRLRRPRRRGGPPPRPAPPAPPGGGGAATLGNESGIGCLMPRR